MNLKYPILILLALSNLSVFSQTFNELTDNEIDAESISEEHLNSFIANIYSFIGEDFDSLDIQILLNSPFIGSLMVETASKKERLTYGYVYDKFLELKQFPDYDIIREQELIATELMKRPADFQNWEEDRPLFIELGFEGDLLESLRLYIEENSNPEENYETVLVGFQEEQQAVYQEEEEKMVKDIKEISATSRLFNEEEILAQSKRENKPILLYFTGNANVNCRRMEYNILFVPSVAEVIMNEFILVPLFVDDKSELPKEEQREVILGGSVRELKMIGDKHRYYQASRFKVSAEPYFVVLNQENEILGITDYSSSSVTEFLLFLNASHNKFKE